MTASHCVVALAFAGLLFAQPSVGQGQLSAEERAHYEGFLRDADRALAQNPHDLDAMWKRGHALAVLEKTQDAGAAFDALLAAARSAGDRPFEARGYDGRGLVARLSGNPVLASQYFEKALAIALELGDAQLALNIRGNLAYAQLEAGHPKKALPILEEILQNKRAAQADDEIAIAATQLGTLHYRAGDLDAAERLFLESLEAAKRMNSPMWLSAARTNLRLVAEARERTQ